MEDRPPNDTELIARAKRGELEAYEEIVDLTRPGLPRARTRRLGLLVSEFRGDLDPNYLGKVVGPGGVVERLAVMAERPSGSKGCRTSSSIATRAGG